MWFSQRENGFIIGRNDLTAISLSSFGVALPLCCLDEAIFHGFVGVVIVVVDSACSFETGYICTIIAPPPPSSHPNSLSAPRRRRRLVCVKLLLSSGESRSSSHSSLLPPPSV